MYKVAFAKWARRTEEELSLEIDVVEFVTDEQKIIQQFYDQVSPRGTKEILDEAVIAIEKMYDNNRDAAVCDRLRHAARCLKSISGELYD